ncbi:GTPase ObgE [Candidatus Saccharibacteria bacterium]|nr:GTPase ObgE [Candidatus Saccharibacteria bacterium]
MFVDTAKVKLKAGKGGDGAVSFRHEIYIPKGGPDGGDGGKGGSIIFRADKDTNTLLDFRFNPELKAEDGKNGSGTRSAGRSGKDLIVEVPIGTTVWRMSASERTCIADLITDGQTAVIARGGDGGFGNAHFKSSTRQAPIIAEVGEPGEEFEAELELKLLADVGLVGLPNAGKSTFLSVVSNAKPEIADYPFTTITPNLGVATIDGRDLLIADIPGLIEGAAEGKGLGHAFLRHVDRTAVLLHLIDVYNDDAGRAYGIIRTELEKYSDLKSRPEIVALTKCEGLDPELIEMQKQSILAINPRARIFAISSSAHQGLEELLRAVCRVASRRGEDGSFSGSFSNDVAAGANLSIVAQHGGYGRVLGAEPRNDGSEDAGDASEGLRKAASEHIPVISLNPNQIKTTWHVEKQENDDGVKFVVTGEKIEKFARRTDFSNYASVNRLRDILKKMGIRAELTSKGATPDSIISIADREFTLVEDW